MGLYGPEDIIGDARKGKRDLLPLSKSACFSDICDGIYPKPVKLGHHSLWLVADIHAFLHAVSLGEFA